MTERGRKMEICASSDSPSILGDSEQERKAHSVPKTKDLQSLHASPQSVMDDATTLTSFSVALTPQGKGCKKMRRRCRRNINSIHYIDSGSVATSVMEHDDESSYSFVRNRIRVGRISDDNEGKESKEIEEADETVVGKFVSSSPLKKLHEFITGIPCCSSGGRVLTGKPCIPYRYNDDGFDDDDIEIDSHYTDDGDDYDDQYGEEISLDEDDEMTIDHSVEEYEGTRPRAESESLASGKNYNTDDDSMSHESVKSSHQHSLNKNPFPNKKTVSKTERRRKKQRGRSVTKRHGYNSGNETYHHSSHSKDTASSRVSDSSSAFNGVTRDNDRDYDKSLIEQQSMISTGQGSSQQSVAESILSKDHSIWMSLTKPSNSTGRSKLQADNFGQMPKSEKKDSANKQNESATTSVVSWEANAVEGYFKVWQFNVAMVHFYSTTG